MKEGLVHEAARRTPWELKQMEFARVSAFSPRAQELGQGLGREVKDPTRVFKSLSQKQSACGTRADKGGLKAIKAAGMRGMLVTLVPGSVQAG